MGVDGKIEGVKEGCEECEKGDIAGAVDMNEGGGVV